ncbi:hypothetical protein SLEP1_g9305 [Rubroshorea leprosula]|uniref:SWIM-type domain-containing protein n=1 Tax=Rubroshorea leprosula TaxID=152421 RepID=A0AAV5IFQ7_9ROSI|nr:hypothetical protein SLEP1_g9305 [Rubroshorea leprosula]
MDPNDPKIVDVDLEPSEEIIEDKGEYDLGNEAQTKSVPIFIHLGGRDRLTLFELYTKIGIAGYDADMVNQIWYLEPRKTITDGLKPIRNDDDIRDVLAVLNVEKKVHIYVSHVLDFVEIIPILSLPAPSDKGNVEDNPAEVEGRVENDPVDVEGRVEDARHAIEIKARAEDASHVVEVEGRVKDAGNDGNEDNEHSEDEDDFLPYISKLSDNKDEKTIEARKKMKSLHKATSRLKNSRKGVKYGPSQPSTGTSHETPSSSIGQNDLGPEDSLSPDDDDDDISYISTSEEDGSEVEHDRRRKELRKRDPGAIVSIYALRPLPNLNPLFLRIYVCFSAMKKGFIARCRRIIGLDGAFLKGAHKEELPAVVGRDANDQMYPTAWEFNAALTELGTLKPVARDDIMSVDPKHWSKAFFKTEIKSSVVNNNMCEVFNALLVDALHKAIISLNQEMTAMEGSKKCRVLWPSGVGCEVEDFMDSKNKVESGRNTYIVNLEDSTCTCRYWDLFGIPCRHAITVLSLKKLRVDEYVSDWYKLSTFKASYAYEVPVVEGMNQWTPTRMLTIQPPVPRKMPGKPKKKRNHEEWEGKTKMGRQGRKITCQKCFQKGHNFRSCKGQPPNVPQMENEPSMEQPPLLRTTIHPLLMTTSHPILRIVSPPLLRTTSNTLLRNSHPMEKTTNHVLLRKN